MPDELNGSMNADERRRDAAIKDALRALPMLTPERDLWAGIAASLPATAKASPRRRWPIPMAAAAAILVAVLVLPMFRANPPTGIDSATPDDARAAWIAESQALESTLRGLEHRPLDARSAMAGAEIEDLIGLTDLQLSVAERPEDELALWQQRVLLMNELTQVRRSGRARVAADNADMMPASYRLN